MRISFDLGETIISQDTEWEVEPNLKGFRGNEWRLRKGAVELFKWIREHNHEIWIYSNSYVDRHVLASWFQDCGIPVDGVINQIDHDKKRREEDPECELEKNPEWFGIDLHFDDFDELADQDRIHNIDPSDSSWTDTVKQLIKQKTSQN